MKDEIIIEDFVDNDIIELEERMHVPVLENLTIIPSEKQQVFKSTKDGFNEVVVEGVEGDELTIIPTTEEQINEGLFNKVITNPIEVEELIVTPSSKEQVHEGMFNKVTVSPESRKPLNIENLIRWTDGTYTFCKIPKLDTKFIMYVKLKEGETFPNNLGIAFTEEGDFNNNQKMKWIVNNGVYTGNAINFGNGYYVITNEVSGVLLNYISVYPKNQRNTLNTYLELLLEEVK